MAVDANREVDLARQLLQEVRSGASIWRASGPEFGTWKQKVLALIGRVFGRGSQEEKDFIKHALYTIWAVVGSDPGYDGRLQQEFLAMLPRAGSFMEALVQDLEMRLPSAHKALATAVQGMRPKIFIGHGGHTSNRDQLELFLWRKGHRPIIVDDMPSLGMGPDAKVDHYLKQSSFAVILCEGDRASSQDGKLYPRLNLIDELARVRKTLGDKFMVLLENGLSLPSNQIGAVVWESFAPKSVDQALGAVERELEAHGILGVND